MRVYDAPSIRNIALAGHGGCGKTSLVSAMLFDMGAVSRLGRVDDGTTVTDFDPDEIERRIDRKSTRLNSSHGYISYAVFCLKKKKKREQVPIGGDRKRPTALRHTVHF